MDREPPTRWDIFQDLCRIIGGCNERVLPDCVKAGRMPLIIAMAEEEDVLPALAVRCEGHEVGADRDKLAMALKANVLRNIQFSAQAINLAKCLNRSGITPLFLKGTIHLLNNKEMNIGFRKQVDIDFIVEPEELEAAGDALLRGGYHYLPEDVSNQIVTLDTPSAIRLSKAHHHLPPMAKPGHPATVDLHRHFLPKRFQAHNPLEDLFSSAEKHNRGGATFLLPSNQQQLLHLLQGKVIHEGHLIKKSFPIREACDYLALTKSHETHINWQKVEQICGSSAQRFADQVKQLMCAKRAAEFDDARNPSLKSMEKRYNSTSYCRFLDRKSRLLHLSYSLRYGPSKLFPYLRRLTK